MKEKIYSSAPNIIQNLLVTVFNILAYNKRYGKKYKKYLDYYKNSNHLSYDELVKIQEEKFVKFVNKTIKKSKFYSEFYSNINEIKSLDDIKKLPILDKETLRENIKNVYTIKKSNGIVSKTGKSLEVIFSPENMQERFAMLDAFRNGFGYKLGKKTAWFSGKNLLSSNDIQNKKFWKTDYLYKVRYYSTFHIKEEYLKYYIEDLIKYQPKYIVGFPSTILEIAKFGKKNGYTYSKEITQAIFPTAETITLEMRNEIESFFNAKIYNQYASSEGAPFIFECINGNLHLELQSGVFEVLDNNNRYSKEGRLVITSFTTDATPLIRYDIGDRIKLETIDKKCNCGNNNPMVKEILGRIDDYIYSPETGKVNLGNVSNTLKDTKGIVRFQAIQNSLNSIDILLVVDGIEYNKSIEKKFLQNWKDRVGSKMVLNISYVNNIPVEKSGKYRIVKNNIKNQIDWKKNSYA